MQQLEICAVFSYYERSGDKRANFMNERCYECLEWCFQPEYNIPVGLNKCLCELLTDMEKYREFLRIFLQKPNAFGTEYEESRDDYISNLMGLGEGNNVFLDHPEKGIL
tara:strand:- start:1289 stop:1615 length:327 start_codon:yes stop_codon:yes gene_type:complete